MSEHFKSLFLTAAIFISYIFGYPVVVMTVGVIGIVDLCANYKKASSHELSAHAFLGRATLSLSQLTMLLAIISGVLLDKLNFSEVVFKIVFIGLLLISAFFFLLYLAYRYKNRH